MKLGVTLLIIGLVLVGIGFTFWQVGKSQTSLLAMARTAGGVGVLFLGGGLTIGGIVRMVVGR